MLSFKYKSVFLLHSYCQMYFKKFLYQKSSSVCSQFDLVVVGGGIVGVAAAREILIRHPKLRVAIVEKERHLAYHQSGRNSGVIHAGIYYIPGSLKAKLCVEGLCQTYAYCEEKKIPYKKCGKLIVATNSIECERLMVLYERGLKNKVPNLELINGDKIKHYQPNCCGVKAIWSPETGIIDWGLVTQNYAKDFQEAGGLIFLHFNVVKFVETGECNYPIKIIPKCGEPIKARRILTCGGLYSDKLAKLTGCSPNPRIVPFRGQYLLLKPEKCDMIKTNIYPVPDPAFPFLGVHFTPRMDGSVWLGPNAVLAFKREGYKLTDINISEMFDAISYPGFIKLAAKFIKPGLSEMIKSIYIPFQMKELQKFMPDIKSNDVIRGPSGVRAQALAPDGNLVDDFLFDFGSGQGPLAKFVLHCRNAPSPAATSSLPIGKEIANKIEKDLGILCFK